MKANRPTLLVVDDEPEVLRSVYDLLRLDYRVITCHRGADALRILDSPEEIHAVMSDQRMPEISGVEILSRSKQVRPETTRLLFTAYADIRAVIDAINEGSVFRYITKPWDPDELETVVRQAVEHHNLIVERERLMTELRESNRRLSEANRLKGVFIEVASHELNTPVAVIVGMTELWKLEQGEAASPAERGWVERIHGAGKRLAGIVERMLKLVRTEQFGTSLQLWTTELGPLIRGVVSDLQPYLTEREQRVELDLDPELGSAEVDPSKLADILTNLLANAIKFTPNGQSVRVVARPDGPDRVQFQVTDRGIGIDPADRLYLFEPFFTGFDTGHHSSGDYQFNKRGMGLGLCLVKAFVELHGGTIDVTSEPGRGSTFRFTLPRRPALAGPDRDGIRGGNSAG
ncbi:MAG: hybrid sensor histidine kinase/response regulator [Planctomycetaceae bacterium]|nr:hybrid sensor histidine kinase/response regulator [Planctomycetaceae bacterium]